MPNTCKVLLLLLIFILPIVVADREDPSINISLSKTQYAPLDHLEGQILLNFKDPVENKNLQLFIGENTVKKELITILSDLSLSYNSTQERNSLTGDGSDIIFSTSEKLIGFETPLSSTGASIDINSPIIGSESGGSFPKFVSIDIGNDDSVEWKWLGSITSWSNYKGSDDLDITQIGSATINNKNFLVCEIVDFPSEVKEVNISARYKTIDQSTRMRGVVFIPTPPIDNQFSGGIIRPPCNLPNSQEFAWNECNIKFSDPAITKGKRLICIYSETGTGASDMFTVSTDSGVSSVSAVSCANNVCTKELNNYFIRASIPTYDGILNGQHIFKDGLTGNLDGGNFVKEINKSMQLTTCKKTDDGNCIVTIMVSSETNGRLFLGGVIVYLSTPGQTLTASYKTLQTQPEVVNAIQNTDLEDNYTLSIPLNIFPNFTTPSVNEFLLVPFRVVYGLEFAQIPIQVFSSIQGDVANESIINTLNLIDTYNSDSDIKSILSFLNIDIQTAKSTLSSLKTELEELEDTDLSPENKSKEKQRILTRAEQARSNIPQSFLFKDKVPSLPAIPPSSIKRDKILPAAKRTDEIENYILAIQSDADIRTQAHAFKLTTYAGDTIEKTFVKRVISNSFSDAFLIEELPSLIASDSSTIDFGGDSSTSIISTNPILIKYELSSGSNTFAYMVNGDIISSMGSLKTLLVTTEGISDTGSFQLPICGDSKCYPYLEDEVNCPEDCAKKVPWIAITVVIIILIAGIYYINFYRGTGNIRSFLKKKELFKTESDKTNLIYYIEKSKKTISNEKITKILLSKGWTKKQINYALKKSK